MTISVKHQVRRIIITLFGKYDSKYGDIINFGTQKSIFALRNPYWSMKTLIGHHKHGIFHIWPGSRPRSISTLGQILTLNLEVSGLRYAWQKIEKI